MNRFYRLRGIALLLSLLMLNPGPELFAKTRKGDKLYKLAQQAETRKEYDKALTLYDEALAEDPSDPAYNLGSRRMREKVGQIHMANAKKLRDDGKLSEALTEYQKSFATDPSNALSLQEMQRTSEMIERNKKGNVKADELNLTPTEVARNEEMQRMSSILPVPDLKPITNRIETLKMNNQPPKVLYDTVGKYAGINVIFDPAMQPPAKNINVDITNATVEEALNYIGLLTKTFWKPVTSNAIFVTEDSVTKRRDYEDNVVKVFYLKNITSVQEFQEIVTAVRSVTDIRRMFTYNAQNAVMARGTPDQIALAEKLFSDLDKPKSEVIVDIVVMSANTDRAKTLAASIVGAATGATGLELPLQFSPRNPVLTGTTTTGTSSTTGAGTTTGTGTTTTGTGTTGTTGTTTTNSSYISLAQIGHVSLNDFSISLPGALLQALMTDSSTRIMQSPQVRASDGQKVTLKIGQKIPYATGSFQPGLAGSVGGVSPLVSTQFNFADVGVNVELTPHVHGPDEVTLHVSVEISSVASQVTIGGVQQPIIAQEKNEAELRLRDGQVTIMGGLTQTQDTKSLAGIPGLVNIPVLGMLGGSRVTDKSRGELLIALIPHIVRTPTITPLDLRGVSAGTDQVVKLNYAEHENPAAAAPPTPAAAAPSPKTPPNMTPPGAPAPGISPAPPTGAPAITFAPSSASVPLSGPLSVNLNAQNVADLFSAGPVRLKWDPKLLRLNQIAPGDFMKQDGQNPPVIDIRNDTGEATISVSRTPGSAGANGSGVLATLSFIAIGKGSGSVNVVEAPLKDSKQKLIAAAVPVLTFTVQ
ncbi:MAG: secretin N-terminal domain-containing protein [Bryobacteraceae bacterium]